MKLILRLALAALVLWLVAGAAGLPLVPEAMLPLAAGP